MTTKTPVPAAWWEAHKDEVLAGVGIPDPIRPIIERRPPDWTWDDDAPIPGGDPYFEESTHHAVFSSWVEREFVRPMKLRRFYQWDASPLSPSVGFSILVDYPALRSRSWPA